MKRKKTPTRLELHRLKYVADGCLGTLLSYDELDEEERSLISKEFLGALRFYGYEMDPYVLLSQVLISWGVMCFHPVERCITRTNSVECSCCGCLVIPKNIEISIGCKSVI